ncbi:hypothetical protein [Rhodanobacter hydrolyticus]|uniref:DUF1566 domain-containing protein n=1 Tax=Rhodanobacter hydrolyticus TaxID=2250595 RepID=A0ABW8J3R8_9GAMM
MSIIDFAKPAILKISPAGDIMPLDAKGHAAIRYPDFGVEFAVGAGLLARNIKFDTAVKKCRDLQHAGDDGWILAPDLRLHLLTVDYSRSGPAADPDLFPDAVSEWHWTAHGCEWAGKDEDGTPRAFWQVYGSSGHVLYGDRGRYYGVVRPCRLVPRPGQ